MNNLGANATACRHKEIKELRRRNLFLSLLSLAFMVGLIVSSSLALADPRKAAAEEQATRLPGLHDRALAPPHPPAGAYQRT